jgi:hypothetical protein
MFGFETLKNPLQGSKNSMCILSRGNQRKSTSQASSYVKRFKVYIQLEKEAVPRAERS